jgi:hypothetical protein
MIKKITLLLLPLICMLFQARAGMDEYWQITHPALVQPAGKQTLNPVTFKAYVLQTAALRERLFALKEDPAQGEVIDLPTPGGGSRSFRIWQSSIMEPALAAKYADIRTFTAEAIDDRRVTAKIDISPAGFHAMVFNGNNTYFIDPYSDTEDGNYLVYFKKDHPRNSSMSCGVAGTFESPQTGEGVTAGRTYGTQRKTYRLALACTGEYAAAVGGATPTKASVLAQMVLIMNRVNGVYEREFASRMVLVANTDTLIFLNSATDPYTNNDGGAMLGENQTTVTARVGSANYDIGHVFSTGGGGIAGLGVICSGSTKAWGVTGLSNPVGDPFAIDYVAHEIGHQYGSDHTFNSSLGACSGNANNSMSFEPGSGSTIMAYAGICGTDDLQSNSDAYFHAVSLRNITNYITTGNGNTCAAITASTNVPNTYPDFTQSYAIPLWTPFELTAPAVSDATQDTLTYCWEEWDLGGFGQPWNANNNVMPYFRSFSPSTSPTRVFPVMDRILAGSYSYRGERLPTAARTLKFIMTTRDIYQGWGCFNSSFDSDTVTLNVVSPGTDTFKVTSQATGTTWNNGSTQTVTWTVANTTAAPINAANVNIYLSVDSGKTFPYTLASNVPNNGSASVTLPGVLPASNKARVKVKAANNVFFQINRSNITINVVPLPVDLLSFQATLKGCHVQLSWTAAGIQGFSHFELERSSNGSTFTTVAKVGNNTSHAYNYTDEPGKDGSYYYRLKMNDLDGGFTYSPVIEVRLSCVGQHSVAVFPNPAKDLITIQSNGTAVEAVVFAANGQLVRKQKLGALSSAQMNIGGLAHGIYLLQITHTDGTRNTMKLIKE